MKYVMAIIAFSLVGSAGAFAEPVLMLNEARDIFIAQNSCQWAEAEIKSYQSLIKAFKCGEVEECQRVMDIDATCKVRGPVNDVRAFHSKLLAQFASNPQCAITIMRLSDDKSDKAVKNNLEAFERANWELNLGFIPGATKQGWALWRYQSGSIVGPALEGEGDPAQIARDVCTIVTRSGAKIVN
jgi:hypothetical protein